MKNRLLESVKIEAEEIPSTTQILTNESTNFLVKLHRKFNSQRIALLKARQERQKKIDAGELPQFILNTASIRQDLTWQVAATPYDLQKRWVEITGPTDKKMLINALNSGANVFMADFEDANSPTWKNVIEGQQNLIDAIKRRLVFTSPEGKRYELNDSLAVLMMRPRGWHLNEKHFIVDDELISASLFDFGLYFFHNAKELIKNGSGPYFYLPKLESHLEARLWNDVFTFAQEELQIPKGTIRATVLIETILAAFEMEEILYELREHSAGLNAGRWDYIFSIIKKFRAQHFIFPDRSEITMTVPFMRSYTQLLVETCHKRGAHALGGMAAFIPSRKDSAVNAVALAKVSEDKLRESSDGFDGTWVAHPDLVSLAQEIFKKALNNQSNQKETKRAAIQIKAEDLIHFDISGGTITEEGMRKNILITLQYFQYWLSGIGAVALFNLMEDAATAEISRAQLWQWVHHQAILTNGKKVTLELYQQFADEEIKLIKNKEHLNEAKDLLDQLVLSKNFPEFATELAYVNLKG